MAESSNSFPESDNPLYLELKKIDDKVIKGFKHLHGSLLVPIIDPIFEKVVQMLSTGKQDPDEAFFKYYVFLINIFYSDSAFRYWFVKILSIIQYKPYFNLTDDFSLAILLMREGLHHDLTRSSLDYEIEPEEIEQE